MKAINVQLRLLLKAIRYYDSERAFAYYIRMGGYLYALQDTGTFDTAKSSVSTASPSTPTASVTAAITGNSFTPSRHAPL